MASLSDKSNKEQKVSKSKDRESGEVQTDNKILRAQQFIYNNSKAISYGLIGLIVVVTLIFILKNTFQKSAEEDKENAMVALTRILPYYEAPDYRKALYGDSSVTVRGEKIIGLLEIVEKYESTEQGKLAALYVGSSYLALNKAKEAIEFFEIATDSPSKAVLTGAFAGLGASYELLKDNEAATEYYLKASESAISEATKERYNYYAARIYENIGNKEAASKIYKEIISKDKFSEFSNYSKAGLVRLGMKID